MAHLTVKSALFEKIAEDLKMENGVNLSARVPQRIVPTPGEFKMTSNSLPLNPRTPLNSPSVIEHIDLGELSAKFESAKPGAGAVGFDAHGGWSYGTFQIASKVGSMALFLDYLRTAQPQAYALLEKAGGSIGAMKGTKEFKEAWQALASDKALGVSFAQAQYQFIKTQSFDVLAAKVSKDTGLDVSQRSVALQNVLWSIATQHGAKSNVISNALNGKDVSKMTDRQIIEAIYAERSAVDVNRHGVKVARYFPSSTPAIQAAVLNRFERELPAALAMLDKEIAAAK